MCGRVIWITGLSGAGKTLTANKLASRLRRSGESIIVLDGDELRQVFGADYINDKNHGRSGRLALAYKYSKLCELIAAQGVTIIIATISLFKEIHAWNRANLPNYYEIYLKISIEELRRRDPKGIYRRFYAGEINNVAGLDLPIDEPIKPDFVVNSENGLETDELVDELLHNLQNG